MNTTVLPCVAIGFCLALPAAAQQNCPTAADLDRGIRIDFVDGSSETFRTQGPGIVVVDGREADGVTYRLELGHGLHLLSYETMVDGMPDPASAVSYDYGMEASALPVPAPQGRHRLDMAPRDSLGSRDEAQTHAYGKLHSVLIGGCTYDMFEAVILYETTDFYTEGLEYLPQLGIGYLVWTENTDIARVPLGAVGIRVVK